MTQLFRVTRVLLWGLIACGLAFAQTETGQISGTVTDPTGAVVPTAKVTATFVATNSIRTTQTSSSGAYVLTNLLPGDYQVKVEASGFSSSIANVTLVVGSTTTRDFKLEVGNAQTVVQVEESAVAVQTESQTLSTTITNRQLLELPTQTRNPYALVAVAGNVADTDPAGRGVGYAINGQRSSGTNVLLDGAANNDEFGAGVGQRVPLDSLQEFSILTSNYTPEFGRASAGVVNVATKSGSNEFHGTAYWFNRVSALASNDFGNNANGVDKAVYTRNQPGYSVGGPAIKNKVFFFNSTEWIRIRSGANVINYIPAPELIAKTPSNVQQYFSSLGKMRSGLTTLSTLTKADLLARGVNPCVSGGLCAALPSSMPMFQRVTYTVPRDSGGGTPQDTYFGVARVDYAMSDKTQMYVRYAYEGENDAAGSNAYSPYAGYDTTNKNFNNNVLFSVVRSFNPRLVSQSKVVFNRLNNTQPLGDSAPSPTLYLASRTAATKLLGDNVALPGYLPFSPGSGIPFGGPQNFIQLYEDLNYTAGKHQLRFGATYTYIRDNRTFGAYQNPVQQVGSNFARGVEGLLTGQATTFQSAIDPQGKYPCNGTATPSCTVNLPVNQPNFSRSNRYHEWAAYFNDTWRATRNITLNLGVRYEFFGVQHNKNPQLDSNFYPAQAGSIFQSVSQGQVATAPNSYVGALWKPDWNNFAPRLGFAWNVGGDGKTSIRGGYGMTYERNFGNVTFNVIQNPPNYAVIALTNGVDVASLPISTALTGPLAGSTGSKALPAVSLRAVDPNIRNAYVHSWSLSVERQVSKGTVVAAEYSGSKGSKLYSIENPNKIGAGNAFLGIPCTPSGTGSGEYGTCTARLLQNAGYTNINQRGGKGFNNYNALNLRVTAQEFQKLGLTLTANYTYSHSIDNLSDTFSSSGNQYNLGLTDPFNPKLDKGDSYYDLRHRFATSAIYAIPFAKGTHGVAKMVLDGWQVAPILTLQTGSPYTIYDSTNAYFEITPRVFLDGAAPKMNNVPVTPTSTPNLNTWVDLSKFPIDSSWINPITKTAEIGPFPATMTGRNFFRTPGRWNLDFALSKTTQLTERFSAQLRLETYNTFNHANMYVDTGNVDVAATSEINSYRSGNRNVQLGLKLLF